MKQIIPNPPWPQNSKIEIKPGIPVAAQFGERELTMLRNNALAGDINSAIYLREYFLAVKPMQISEVDYWVRVAAENGDRASAGSLAMKYSDAGGLENCLRAKFWLEKAGMEDSRESHTVNPTLLTNLEVLADTWDQCVARGQRSAP